MARFWVGNNTNWNSTASWSTSSGGSSGASVPANTDDVFFDSNSGANAANITAAAVCHSWTISSGYTGTITHSASVSVTVGSGTAPPSNIALSWASGWTYSVAANNSSINLSTSVASTAMTVNFNGFGVGNVTFSCAASSSYTLVSAYQYASGLTPSTTHGGGTLYLNAQTVNASAFLSTGANTRTLDMTNTTLNVVSNFTLSGTGLTVVSTGSTVQYNIVSVTSTFTINGYTINNLVVSCTLSTNTHFEIATSGTVNNFTVTQNAGTGTLFFGINTAGITMTVNGTFSATGLSGQQIQHTSSVPGTRVNWVINAANPLAYFMATDMGVTGAAMPLNAYTLAGNIDGGDNSGIQFNANYDVIQATTVGTGAAGVAASPPITTTTGHMLVAIPTENATGNTWNITETAVFDQISKKTQGTNSGTITTNNFTTTVANEVLYAIIIADGTTAGITSVTGAGLTWTQQIHNNVTSRGTVEVWTAVTTSILTSQAVTAASANTSADMSITLLTYYGANPTSPIGASNKTIISAGTATTTLTTNNPGSNVWAAALDTTQSSSATVGTNQTRQNQFLDANDAQTHVIWNQNLSTPVASTAVTMNLTTNTSDTYNLVAFEINAAPTNGWTQAITETNTGQKVDIWYEKNITGNGSSTITATSSANTTNVAIIVYECIGMDLSSPLDKTAVAATTGASPVTASTGTLSQANEIAIGGVISADTTAAHFTQNTAKGVLTPYPLEVSTVYTIVANHLSVSATTALTIGFKNTTSAAYAIVGATFKYTAAVANTGNFLMLM